MGHGRETTLSLNFKTSCISIPNINCIYITGTSWHIVFGIEFCGLLRCVTVGRRGEGERRENTFYLFFYGLEYLSLQEVSSYCESAYPMKPDLRWHGQQLPYNLQQLIYTYSRCTLPPSTEFYARKCICFSTHILITVVVLVPTRYNENGSPPRDRGNLLVNENRIWCWKMLFPLVFCVTINAGTATFTPRDTQQQRTWCSQKDNSRNLHLLLLLDCWDVGIALLLLLPLLLGTLLGVFFALLLVRHNSVPTALLRARYTAECVVVR